MFGYGKEITLGMIGAFLQMGLNIDKIDWETETLYITIPERSYDYEFSAKNGGAVVSPEALAKRIKETSNEMGIFKNGKVKYRTKDIYWTKKMGEENYRNNIDDYYRIVSRLQGGIMNKDSYGRVSWDDLSLPPKINAVPLRENKPLKVYQIVKAVGCYEDYHEYVVGTYLHKQKVENELAHLKAEVPDCDECPYSEEYQDKPIETSCPHHKPKKYTKNWHGDDCILYGCKNCIDPYDAPSYRMKEYEVDESEV